jgi:RNA polymerase sigma factor (sigma-70 family)
MTDDMALVREYARNHSETAFAALVSRHLNLVYSVALREVHDPHLAEEVTQAAFIILSRKAGVLGPKTILSGWLCRTARYVSAEMLRSQRRRQTREQEAYMQSLLNDTESNAWMQIAPLLETAMAQLGEQEHNAIVLRFYEGKALKQVGVALGTGEDAARMRINRALEKLRKFFVRRGLTFSAAVIAAAVSTSAVQAAPVGLAATVTAAAVQGTAVTTSTLTLIKGALKIMACTKMKATIVAGVVALLVAGTTPIVIHHFREFSWTHELSSDEVSQYSNRTGTTPEQVTKTFFDACGHEDWTAVSTFWEAGGYPLDDRFKSHYGGLQIINLGRPFWARFRHGERYPGVLVPYEIRLQDGKISKGRLAIRCDNPDNRWYFDGGM